MNPSAVVLRRVTLVTHRFWDRMARIWIIQNYILSQFLPLRFWLRGKDSWGSTLSWRHHHFSKNSYYSLILPIDVWPVGWLYDGYHLPCLHSICSLHLRKAPRYSDCRFRTTRIYILVAERNGLRGRVTSWSIGWMQPSLVIGWLCNPRVPFILRSPGVSME